MEILFKKVYINIEDIRYIKIKGTNIKIFLNLSTISINMDTNTDTDTDTNINKELNRIKFTRFGNYAFSIPTVTFIEHNIIHPFNIQVNLSTIEICDILKSEWVEFDSRFFRRKDLIIAYQCGKQLLLKTKYFTINTKELYSTSDIHYLHGFIQLNYKDIINVFVNNINCICLMSKGININNQMIIIGTKRIDRQQLLAKIFNKFTNDLK